MNTQANHQPARGMGSVLYLFLFILLAAHLFVYCWLLPPVPGSPLARAIVYRFHELLSDPRIMRFIRAAKPAILVLQIVIVFADPPKFTNKKAFTQPLILFILGCLLFFGSDIWLDEGGNSSLPYPILTVVGYLVLIPASYNLYRAAFDPFDGLFTKKKIDPGFRQTERFVRADRPLHLRGNYRLNGR